MRGAAHLGSTLSLHQPRVSVYHVTSIPQLCPSTAPLLCHSTHAVSGLLSPAHGCVPLPVSTRQLSSPALTTNTQVFKLDDLRLIHRTHSRRHDEQGEHPRPRVWPHRVLVTSLVSASLVFISTHSIRNCTMISTSGHPHRHPSPARLPRACKRESV